MNLNILEIEFKRYLKSKLDFKEKVDMLSGKILHNIFGINPLITLHYFEFKRKRPELFNRK